MIPKIYGMSIDQSYSNCSVVSLILIVSDKSSLTTVFAQAAGKTDPSKPLPPISFPVAEGFIQSMRTLIIGIRFCTGLALCNTIIRQVGPSLIKLNINSFIKKFRLALVGVLPTIPRLLMRDYNIIES